MNQQHPSPVEARGPTARALSRLTGLVAGLAAVPWLAGDAQACSPWAERVVAWDMDADVAVVAIWPERDTPPPARSALRPEQHELRRISTRRVVASHPCDADAAGAAAKPCDWQAAFAQAVTPAPKWQRQGAPVQRGQLRVRTTRPVPGTFEFVLDARGKRGWQPVSWLDFVSVGYPERRRYDVVDSELRNGRAVIALAYHSRGGNCRHTAVQLLALHERDLNEPRHPDRRARLAAQAPEYRPYGHWRTLAEIGPLPPERLVEAMQAAEAAGRPELAATWWAQTAPQLTASQRAQMTAAISRDPGLAQTHQRLQSQGRVGARP